MKCPNCHGDEINGNNTCNLCGLDINKYDKTRENTEKGVYKIQKFDKFIKIFGIVVFIFIMLLIFLPDGTYNLSLFSLPLFGPVFLIPFAIKIIAIGFVTWISISLIKQGTASRRDYKSNNVVEGVVVDNKNIKEVHTGSKGFAPIIEYKINGKKYRLIGEYKGKEELGKKLNVRYNINNPFEAIVDGSKQGYSSLGLGIFLLIVCIFFLIFA